MYQVVERARTNLMASISDSGEFTEYEADLDADKLAGYVTLNTQCRQGDQARENQVELCAHSPEHLHDVQVY